MIRVVTDSAAMLPGDLRDRYDVAVVPLTITIDGRDYTEGVDLTTADFYAFLQGGACVSTAAPAPGAFAAVYGAAAAAGATAVLSIHTGTAYSATVASAAIASRLVDVPVDVVDTGVASFPVALAVWAAAERLAAGDTADMAADAALRTAAETGSVFIVGVPELARRGGRFVAVEGTITPSTVVQLADGALSELAHVGDVSEAIEQMVDRTVQLGRARPIRVGIGHAVRVDVARHLAERLEHGTGITSVTVYDIGPSVGAHTGAGTVGVVYAPAP